MRKVCLTLVIISCLWAFGIGEALADTLNLQTLPPTTYGGYYVGPVTGNINGGYTMQFYCNDFSTTTYVPSSFAVAISNLSDLSNTKFGGQSGALSKYQEAGWLVSQMQSNPTQVGPIQFAIWKIFDSGAPNVPGASDWLSAAQSINPANFDFGSVQVYTPTNTTNQEFVSGGAHALPEPPIIFLLGFGVVCVGLLARKHRKRAAAASARAISSR